MVLVVIPCPYLASVMHILGISMLVVRDTSTQ